MAIPAYANARIEHLNFRYAVEPQIEVRLSYRAVNGKRVRLDDSPKANSFRHEIYCIIDSYNAVPKTPPAKIAYDISVRQKAAIARALKQERDGRI
tara:strand:+ start:108 stop:395 length:288 start_codon:yes stop_codon:yes gene_type:complete